MRQRQALPLTPCFLVTAKVGYEDRGACGSTPKACLRLRRLALTYSAVQSCRQLRQQQRGKSDRSCCWSAASIWIMWNLLWEGCLRPERLKTAVRRRFDCPSDCSMRLKRRLEVLAWLLAGRLLLPLWQPSATSQASNLFFVFGFACSAALHYFTINFFGSSLCIPIFKNCYKLATPIMYSS